jgi:hypothetical protein
MTRLILALLQKSARSTRAEHDLRSGTHVAAYPTAVRAFAWSLLVIGIGVAGVVAAIKAARQEPSMVVVTVLFLVLTAYMVAEFTMVRAEWDDAELNFASPWGSARRLRWTDIVHIEYSASARWFIVRARDGTKIRLHYFLGGLHDLLTEMKQRTSDQVRGQLEQAMRTEFPE